MEKISLKKKMLIIRLYLEGLSYSELAAKANVSKGTIANVIAELKAGRFPEFGDLYEQLELIRELAVDLKRTRLTPVQAAVGVTVLSRLRELEVEPGEIEGLSALYRTLNTEGTDIQTFTRIALSLEEVRKRTGLSVEELEMKVKDLEESASRLEPLVKEVKQTQSALKGLQGNRKSLVEEVVVLEKRHQILKENVRDKEQRETELSSRVRDLEDRAQSADEQLTNTRQDLQTLSGIGMSPDNLTAFTQRLKVVAQRHDMKPKVVCSKLMDDLEQLDKGLGLDTITKVKKQELRRIQVSVLRAKAESAAIGSTNEKLRQERSSLKTALLEERRHISKDFEAINTIARNTIATLKQDLSVGVGDSITEVNKLRDRALDLGKELGQYNEIVESNRWLKGLQALINGDEGVEPDQVRVIGITVTKAMLSWLEYFYPHSADQYMLKLTTRNLIGEFERWKP